ncbi:MAG: YHS domain-containing protein [Chloroflexi bacterium]|nr:YHS domain-containing protein [Chloroflexota bacterium]
MTKGRAPAMHVDGATAKHIAEYDGQPCYFCAPACKRAFHAEPEPHVDPRTRYERDSK